MARTVPVRSARAARERVDGILLLDKPAGIGSNDALMRARRLLNARKAGHGGTLDPLASGLLPLMFGEATKFAQDALDADKTYVARLVLGATTDTGDAEGAVQPRHAARVDEAQVRAACGRFLGRIEQVPPMYSALKRDGRPLYAYARDGVDLPREPRAVTIHALEPVSLELDAAIQEFTIRVRCSKGTYIRTLAADIGETLGCGAYLGALRREAVGRLQVTGAIALGALEAMPLAHRRALLAPVDALLDGLPRLDLSPALARRFESGQRLAGPSLAVESCARPDGLDRHANAVSYAEDGQRRVRVYTESRLLGLARWHDGVLSPLRLIAANTNETSASS